MNFRIESYKRVWNSPVTREINETSQHKSRCAYLHNGEWVTPCIIDRNLGEYLDDLPKIPPAYNASRNELNFVEFIEMRLQALLTYKIDEKVRILDVGCGRGDFLFDMAKHIAEKFFDGNIEKLKKYVDIVGISLGDYRDYYNPETNKCATRATLEGYGIKYIIGDMRRLPESLGGIADGKFDCVVSNYAIGKVGESNKVLALIHGILKFDGIATLADAFSLRGLSFSCISRMKEQKVALYDDFIYRWLNSRVSNFHMQVSPKMGRVVMHNNGEKFELPSEYLEAIRNHVSFLEFVKSIKA